MKKPFALLLLSSVMIAGCTVPAITGALQVAEYGTSTFQRGTLETYFPNEVDECVIAVRKTISDLGLRPVSDSPKPEEGFLYLKVRDDSGEDIFIRVRRRADRLAMVSIRVGMLGDEPYSNALMRHVTDLLDPDKKFDTPPPDYRRKPPVEPAGTTPTGVPPAKNT